MYRGLWFWTNALGHLSKYMSSCTDSPRIGPKYVNSRTLD